MELKDTITLMQSDDYIERFVAEYLQLRIRKERLEELIIKYKCNELPFTPDCSIVMLEMRLAVMIEYMLMLEEQARIEKINLYNVIKSSKLKKTRQDELLKLYPNIRKVNGVIDICPGDLDMYHRCRSGDPSDEGCVECIREYWLQEVEK